VSFRVPHMVILLPRFTSFVSLSLSSRSISITFFFIHQQVLSRSLSSSLQLYLHVRNQNRRRRNWCLVSGASSFIVGQPSRDGSDGIFTFELSFFMWAVWPSYAYEGKGVLLPPSRPSN
jgi:hypothetical protein